MSPATAALPDDDTTKLSHATVDERTSLTLSATQIAGSVLGVQLMAYAKNSVAGADQMAQSVRLSATDYDQTAWQPDTAYAWHLDVLTLNPDTTAQWATSEIDGMELGVVVK